MIKMYLKNNLNVCDKEIVKQYIKNVQFWEPNNCKFKFQRKYLSPIKLTDFRKNDIIVLGKTEDGTTIF